ncbi:MAG: (Fe-S)-binding protein [Bacteroidota bacterium]|nr:(Fe-S)-binding protein [Bacteroidota bacterium]
MEVDIFIPCFVDQIYPETGLNMVKVLEKLGIQIHYNDKQTCCGQMAFNSGFWKEAREIGVKFMEDFPGDRYIVGPSASCVGYVRNYYEELFYNTSHHNEYRKLQKRIFEFSDFLVNVLEVEDIGATFNHSVTYHDSCAALREYGIRDEPRKLLRYVKGLTLLEMQDTNVCCGFGGTFSVKFEAIASAMAEQKVGHALASGAEYIVSTDSSCLMHQQGYIKKHGLGLKVAHLADVLASGW